MKICTKRDIRHRNIALTKNGIKEGINYLKALPGKQRFIIYSGRQSRFRSDQ